MLYLIGKRIVKLVKIRHENEQIMFADQHELTDMVPPRSQYRKADPTLTDSQLSLNRKEKVREGTVTTTL